MKKQNQLFIFDMDGTLLNSKKDIAASINFVRKQKNLPTLHENEIAEIINSDRKTLSKKLYNTETFEKKDKQLFEHHYSIECLKNTKPYDGIINSIKELYQTNSILCIATNAPKQFAIKMLKNTNLLQYFRFVMGACEVENPKPAPDMILKILQKFDIYQSKNAIIIGDNYTDIEAGYNAGIKTAFVEWGFGKINLRKPDFYFTTPSELMKLKEIL